MQRFLLGVWSFVSQLIISLLIWWTWWGFVGVASWTLTPRPLKYFRKVQWGMSGRPFLCKVAHSPCWQIPMLSQGLCSKNVDKHFKQTSAWKTCEKWPQKKRGKPYRQFGMPDACWVFVLHANRLGVCAWVFLGWALNFWAAFCLPSVLCARRVWCLSGTVPILYVLDDARKYQARTAGRTILSNCCQSTFWNKPQSLAQSL